MKVGDTVKLKPAMWQGVKPQSFGMSFTGEYTVKSVSEVNELPYVTLDFIKGCWDMRAFELVKAKNTFKVKVLGANIYEVEELEDGSWKFDFFGGTTPCTYPKSSVTKFLNDGSWEVIKEEEKQLKKFKTGDKVVCVKNTPSIQEGWVGYVDKVFAEYVTARQGYSTTTYDFLMDELEVLCPTKDADNDVNSPTSALDKQISGDHYKSCGIQPIEYIHANGLSYLEGNVIKYTTRHSKKNGRQDIEKAIHYLELILEMEYKDEPK